MPRNRVRQACGVCAVLVMLTPAVAAAQDQLPPPPKQEKVTIRALNGMFELRGTSSPDLFTFTERCEDQPAGSGPVVLLDLPLELEATPNESLELATKLLRDAVTQGIEVAAVPSSEAGQVAVFYWGGLPEFRGVIASVGLKYTMFVPDGTPVRATAHVRIRQAGPANPKKKQQADPKDKGTEKKSC